MNHLSKLLEKNLVPSSGRKLDQLVLLWERGLVDESKQLSGAKWAMHIAES